MRKECAHRVAEDEVDMIEYYRETLGKLFGGIENVPPMKEVERRSMEFSSEVEEDGYVPLNRCQNSMVRGETFKGNWFIYLIALPSTVSSKTDSHVGWTTNPLVDIYLLNSGQTIYKHIGRNISMAIPHWKLDKVIGTLTCEEQAEHLAHIWTDNTRGKKSKRDKAPFISESADAPLYTFTEHLGEETMESLLRDAYISDEFRTTLLQELERK